MSATVPSTPSTPTGSVSTTRPPTPASGSKPSTQSMSAAGKREIRFRIHRKPVVVKGVPKKELAAKMTSSTATSRRRRHKTRPNSPLSQPKLATFSLSDLRLQGTERAKGLMQSAKKNGANILLNQKPVTSLPSAGKSRASLITMTDAAAEDVPNRLLRPPELFDYIDRNRSIRFDTEQAALDKINKQYQRPATSTASLTTEELIRHRALKADFAFNLGLTPKTVFLSEKALDHSSMKDLKVSLTINLFQTGFSLNSDRSGFSPYDRSSRELLNAVDNSELPPFASELLKAFECHYYDGCIIAEVRDFRHVTTFSREPTVHRVMLRPTTESIVTDVQEICRRYLERHSGTPLTSTSIDPTKHTTRSAPPGAPATRVLPTPAGAEERKRVMELEVEKRVLQVLRPSLCLHPSVTVHQVSNLINCNRAKHLPCKLSRSQVFSRMQQQPYPEKPIDKHAATKARADIVDKFREEAQSVVKRHHEEWARISSQGQGQSQEGEGKPRTRGRRRRSSRNKKTSKAGDTDNGADDGKQAAAPTRRGTKRGRESKSETAMDVDGAAEAEQCESQTVKKVKSEPLKEEMDAKEVTAAEAGEARPSVKGTEPAKATPLSERVSAEEAKQRQRFMQSHSILRLANFVYSTREAKENAAFNSLLLDPVMRSTVFKLDRQGAHDQRKRCTITSDVLTPVVPPLQRAAATLPETKEARYQYVSKARQMHEMHVVRKDSSYEGSMCIKSNQDPNPERIYFPLGNEESKNKFVLQYEQSSRRENREKVKEVPVQAETTVRSAHAPHVMTHSVSGAVPSRGGPSRPPHLNTSRRTTSANSSYPYLQSQSNTAQSGSYSYQYASQNSSSAASRRQQPQQQLPPQQQLRSYQTSIDRYTRDIQQLTQHLRTKRLSQQDQRRYQLDLNRRVALVKQLHAASRSLQASIHQQQQAAKK